MKTNIPPIWLIVLLAGIPMFSETVYTPSLPDIARSLQTSDNLVEYTLTIYLLGIALGVLFWGNISDKFGRKPCIIAGLGLYLLGCLGCYLSTSITMLMVARLVQAFGASIGSVLGQAICRDAYHGQALGKAYAIVGSALAIFPALGPVAGGVIAQYSGWNNNFIFLILFGLIALTCVIFKLAETHPHANRKSISLISVADTLFRDKKVVGFGLIVACCNGINFSYFAEGSFYMIELLELTPSFYGATFIIMSVSTLLGGKLSHHLLEKHSPITIVSYGVKTILVGMLCFSVLITTTLWLEIPKNLLIGLVIITIMLNMAGSILANSVALSSALVNYKWCIGTASSLFGSFYYLIISLITLGMGALHNDTLFPMPYYFLGISIFMMFVIQYFLNPIPKESNTREQL